VVEIAPKPINNDGGQNVTDPLGLLSMGFIIQRCPPLIYYPDYGLTKLFGVTKPNPLFTYPSAASK